jgi:hypothetical protein
VPSIGGVGEIDRDLGVLDSSGGAGVLALDPDRARALLHVAGLVDHQHRVGVAEVTDDVVTQVVTGTVGVPDRPSQEVLHPLRIGIPGVFGDAPTVLARQVRQQPTHERACSAAGLHPGEPACHPIQQLVALGHPPGNLYAVAHGHRLIHSRPHNRAGSRGGRSASGTATPQDHELQLEY